MGSDTHHPAGSRRKSTLALRTRKVEEVRRGDPGARCYG